ncbi:MAG: type III secretion system gatekeeper subunit SctW [Victivallales bacterium]|nr:type III secretion system gatekeeper subunit SctW [Victivallales bacterium]
MALDAAQILRQAIATTQFDTSSHPIQEKGAMPESSVAMGMNVHVEVDPLAELMDSMEELSFQFEEKESKNVSERKLGETKGRQNAYIEALQNWMKVMPDMPGAEFLMRMLRMLRAANPLPNAQDFLKWLGNGSNDPSHQFAMLDCLEQALAPTESEMQELVRQAKAELEHTQGPEMRAGINVASEINKRTSSPEEMQNLRDLYRGEVIGFSTPQDCFRSLLASRGPGRLAAEIDFLIAAAGVDLHNTNPSQSPEELRRIILDLQCVEVLRTMLDKMDGMVLRMLHQFGEQCLQTGEALTGRVVDLTEQPFVSSAQVGSILASTGLQQIHARADFATGLLDLFRSLSPRLFQNPTDRFRLTEAAEELMKSEMDELEREEEEEKARKDKQKREERNER